MSTEIQNTINAMQTIIEKTYGDESTLEIESYEYYLAGFFRELCYYLCGEHADTDSWPMNYELFSIIVQAVNNCALQAGVNNGYLMTPYSVPVSRPNNDPDPARANAYKNWIFGTVGYLTDEIASQIENAGRSASTASGDAAQIRSDNTGHMFGELLKSVGGSVAGDVGGRILNNQIPHTTFFTRNPQSPLDIPIRVLNWSDFLQDGVGYWRDALASLREYCKDNENLFNDLFGLLERGESAARDWYKAVFGPIITPTPSESEWLQWPVNMDTLNFINECMNQFQSCTRTVENAASGAMKTMIMLWLGQSILALGGGMLGTVYNEYAKICASRAKTALQALSGLTTTLCWTTPRRNWYYNFVDRFLW